MKANIFQRCNKSPRFKLSKWHAIFSGTHSGNAIFSRYRANSTFLFLNSHYYSKKWQPLKIYSIILISFISAPIDSTCFSLFPFANFTLLIHLNCTCLSIFRWSFNNQLPSERRWRRFSYSTELFLLNFAN